MSMVLNAIKAAGPTIPAEETDAESKTTVTAELEESIDKYAEVYGYLIRGVPVSALAKKYSVDASTIHRWKQKAIEKYKERLEERPVVELVCDHLAFLEQLEQLVLYEAAMLKSDGTIVDAATGHVSSQVDPIKLKRTKLEFWKSAAGFRKAQIDLQVVSGIIPKQPEKIYTSIEREKNSLEAGGKEGEERTREEIQNEIVRLVTMARKITD